jgi:hypothetical protein
MNGTPESDERTAIYLDRLQRSGFGVFVDADDVQTFYIKPSQYTKLFKDVFKPAGGYWCREQRAYCFERRRLPELVFDLQTELDIMSNRKIDRQAVRKELESLCSSLSIELQYTDDGLVTLRPPPNSLDDDMWSFITFAKYCMYDETEDHYYTVAERDIRLLESLRQDVKQRELILDYQRKLGFHQSNTIDNPVNQHEQQSREPDVNTENFKSQKAGTTPSGAAFSSFHHVLNENHGKRKRKFSNENLTVKGKQRKKE